MIPGSAPFPALPDLFRDTPNQRVYHHNLHALAFGIALLRLQVLDYVGSMQAA